ncbi:hypothetical protein NPIL_174541 [Nephila pilipes]|uniref:Uncharacterized protein n=1 Tax=Nephila pilipes TaxID=299642 RepID=A0A8X6QWK8_NEPPI|nr:hypothetical protein NPIL_174541 [Nephila pilipes]
MSEDFQSKAFKRAVVIFQPTWLEYSELLLPIRQCNVFTIWGFRVHYRYELPQVAQLGFAVRPLSVSSESRYLISFRRKKYYNEMKGIAKVFSSKRCQ